VKPNLVQEFFQRLPEKFDPEAGEGVTAVYQFDLSGPQGGQYNLVVDDGTCSVQEGTHPDPHVVFSMSGEDCLGVLSGRLDGQSVFMSGRLRVSGDFGLAYQLKTLFPSVH
jgi:putative sterol carrier protein